MSHQTVCLFFAVSLLAGCAMQSGPGQRAFGSTGPIVVNTPDPDYRHQMTVIAAEYEAAVSWNDPRHVSEDVANCYKNKGNTAIIGNWRTQNLRGCLALDYTAYKDNQIATHNYRTPGNPYFSMETAAERWKVWGPQARFSDPEAMFQYMRGSYALIKPTEISIVNSLHPGNSRRAASPHPKVILPQP